MNGNEGDQEEDNDQDQQQNKKQQGPVQNQQENDAAWGLWPQQPVNLEVQLGPNLNAPPPQEEEMEIDLNQPG